MRYEQHIDLPLGILIALLIMMVAGSIVVTGVFGR